MKGYPKKGSDQKKPTTHNIMLYVLLDGVVSRLLLFCICLVVLVLGVPLVWSCFRVVVLFGCCLGVGLKFVVFGVVFFVVWFWLFVLLCLLALFLGCPTFDQTLRTCQLHFGLLFCSCPSVGALCWTPPCT